jgi:hypothetical protein
MVSRAQTTVKTAGTYYGILLEWIFIHCQIISLTYHYLQPLTPLIPLSFDKERGRDLREGAKPPPFLFPLPFINS